MAFEWALDLPAGKRPENFKSVVKTIFQNFGQDFVSDLGRQNLSGRHGDMGLNRRSGALADGWNSATVSDANSVTTTSWVAGPAADPHGGAHGYAWAEEYGAVIRPVKAKWLWIPTKENQDPTGNAKMTPTEAIQRGGFISYKRAPVFLGVSGSHSKKSAGFTITPLFVLKKEVTIKPRMGAETMFKSKMPMLERSILFAAGDLL